jgi:hypothetical protein
MVGLTLYGQGPGKCRESDRPEKSKAWFIASGSQKPVGILARSEWRTPVNRFHLTRVVGCFRDSKTPTGFKVIGGLPIGESALRVRLSQ